MPHEPRGGCASGSEELDTEERLTAHGSRLNKSLYHEGHEGHEEDQDLFVCFVCFVVKALSKAQGGRPLRDGPLVSSRRTP